MKPILIIMLCVQLAIFVVTVAGVIFRKDEGSKRSSGWMSFALGLVVTAGASWSIARSNVAEDGADILRLGAPVLLGMGIVMLLLAIPERRKAGPFA